jgi:hypothetical protein
MMNLEELGSVAKTELRQKFQKCSPLASLSKSHLMPRMYLLL